MWNNDKSTNKYFKFYNDKGSRNIQICKDQEDQEDIVLNFIYVKKLNNNHLSFFKLIMFYIN